MRTAFTRKAAIALAVALAFSFAGCSANSNTAKERLGIPDDMEAVAVLLIGVVDADSDAVSSASVRNDITERVTYVK